ncbi:hypothetical protein HAX54_048903 [Datura stramonium]|uniref:Electron transfer flavoprotein-ubiquinone oxidoreductase n=1 Tax=Datura stramonium TaxID=4076 RepID=A0ABS8WNM3_DATST|nr:hypothetical protein [Datura stramonium]
MVVAESAFSMLQEGLKMENYWDNLRSSWIWEELYTARNYRPAFEYGLYPGLALSAVEHYILKGRSPVTLNHGKPDHEATRETASTASNGVLNQVLYIFSGSFNTYPGFQSKLLSSLAGIQLAPASMSSLASDVDDGLLRAAIASSLPMELSSPAS